MNHITYKSDAAANKVNVMVLYKKETENGVSSAHIILKPVKEGQRISAFKAVITGDSNVQFVNVGTPLAVEKNIPFTQMEKNITQTKAVISYVVPAPDSSLPSIVTIPVEYIGQGKIIFNTTISQVAGNIPQNIFTFGKVESEN